MIARYGIDGFGHALQGQIEFTFKVLHRSRRIYNVRRDHQEFHLRLVADPEDLVLQHQLGCVTLAGIAHHHEREIG